MKSKNALGKPTRIRTGFTLVLMFIWVLLISFALIAATEPAWMKNLSRFGRSGESEGLKGYGDNFLRQNNYRMAIAQYQRALKIKPDNVGVLINIAKAYHLSGNSSEGLNILQNALKLDSKLSGSIYFNMAEVLGSQGKKEEAIEFFKKSLDSEVVQSLVYCMIGSTYYEMKQYENARLALERALQLQTAPETPYMNMIRQNLPLLENDNKNLAVLEKMLKEGADEGKLKNYDLEIIAKIEGSDPEVAKTHNLLGAVYASMGNIDKAIEHFQQSQQIWPGNIDATKNLQILMNMKNKNPAAPPG